MFGHFVGLALKGLKNIGESKKTVTYDIYLIYYTYTLVYKVFTIVPIKVIFFKAVFKTLYFLIISLVYTALPIFKR